MVMAMVPVMDDMVMVVVMRCVHVRDVLRMV